MDSRALLYDLSENGYSCIKQNFYSDKFKYFGLKPGKGVQKPESTTKNPVGWPLAATIYHWQAQ